MIELIIVMALIGGLTVFFLNSYPASQRRARDTARRNDLKQYQVAVERYANRNTGFYPSRTTSTQANTAAFCVTDLGYSAVTDCPGDPKDGTTACSGVTCRYYYISNGTGSGTPTGTEYVIWGALEQPLSSSNRYFVVCSNGKSGEGVAPSSSACPI